MKMRWNPIHPGVKQYATDIKWAQKQADKIYKHIKLITEINNGFQPKFVIPRYRQES